MFRHATNIIIHQYEQFRMLELLAKQVTAGQRSDLLAALAKIGHPAKGEGEERRFRAMDTRSQSVCL